MADGLSPVQTVDSHLSDRRHPAPEYINRRISAFQWSSYNAFNYHRNDRVILSLCPSGCIPPRIGTFTSLSVRQSPHGCLICMHNWTEMGDWEWGQLGER